MEPDPNGDKGKDEEEERSENSDGGTGDSASNGKLLSPSRS